MLSILLHILIIFVAFGGLLITIYIRNKKQTKRRLVCPLKANCDEVIYSEYSRFLGVPVELLGMLYYAIIVISYVSIAVVPDIATSAMTFMLFILSTTAFLFSSYLTFVQAFLLEQWCTWCLISAAFCASILILILFSTDLGFIPLLEANQYTLLTIQTLGMALGLGGVTISAVFFLKFLRDLKIAQWEANIMRVVDQVVWFGLATIVLTALGLFIPNPTVFAYSPLVAMYAVVVAMIIATGAILNLKIIPSMVKISFGQDHKHTRGELRTMRKLAFAFGATSLTSWYLYFLVRTVEQINLSFETLFLIYAIAIVAAVTVSQVIEKTIVSQRNPTNL